MSQTKKENKNTESEIFQPVIAVLGHVDHGKSSLLDYIRKSNVVEGEAGGITQRISAYEVAFTGENTIKRNITFLDTPGHEAFSSMRERGVEIADIAILVVSAEDGVKAQTIEAWKSIDKRKIPYIVAINKIDKAGADIQRTKNMLVENAIYIEGYGGDVPCVEISAKVGTGISYLLETLLLLSDMHELSVSNEGDATGYVLESFVDNKRGISSTLIIKNGVLPKSGAVLSGVSVSPIRIVENFLGKTITEAHQGQAIKVTGFDTIPSSGAIFVSSPDKKNIDKLQEEALSSQVKEVMDPRVYREAKVVVPVVIKADSLGTLEALKKEIKKKETADVKIKIIGAGMGNISEGDIMLASSDDKTVIIGFAVKIEGKAREQAERFKSEPILFDIIYKVSEWFDTVIEERMPYEEKEVITGTLKVIKNFSSQKDKQVIGGRVESGKIIHGGVVKIMRRGVELGRGKIVELQSQKIKTQEVNEGTECGLMVESKFEIIPSDMLEIIVIEKKRI